MELLIYLNTFDKIERFVRLSTGLECEMDLVSGRYVVDAKSLLGIFSLDLAKPIILRLYQSERCPKELEEFMIYEG